jgi:DNA-binding NarL/FixJ family response regulator
VRVVLVDDAALFRQALAEALEAAEIRVVGQVGDAASVDALVARERPDVVVLDVRMPPTHTTEGLDAALRLRTADPRLGVLVLSQYVESRQAMTLLRSGTGGVGYLLKDRVSDLGELIAALHRVAAGRSVIDPDVVERLLDRPREQGPLDELTGRERDVLGLIAEGRSNAAIASALGLNAKTIEAHVNGVFSKLGLEPAPEDNRRVLAALAWLRG